MWQRKIFSAYRNNTIKQFIFIVLVLFLVRVPDVLAQYDIVEPEIYLQSVEERKAEAQKVFRTRLKLADESSISVTSILLDPLSEQERETIRSAIERQDTTKKRKIGIGRSVPSPYCDAIDPGLYQWISLPEGGVAAVFSVKSPEAMALRAKIKIIHMPKGAELRFYNPTNPEEVYGPYLIDQIRNQMVDNSFWSPVIESSSIAIEIFLPKGLDCDDLSIAIPQVSHLWSSILNSRGYSRLSEIGASGYCNIDIACTNWKGSYEERSVAKMIFTKGGSTWTCTGTALNDKDPSTSIPYFLTAHHCISTQAAASSLITYWNFQKSSCYGPSPSTVTRRTGGAELLSTGSSTDYTLLRLYENLPSGTALAGWTGVTVNYGSEVVGIHHPWGDLKKISFGTTQGFFRCTPFVDGMSTCYPGGGEYIGIVWTRGIIESGSSGSALFDNQGHVIGICSSSVSSCQEPYLPDFYARFDRTYPLIKQWLWETSASDTTSPNTSIASGPSGIIDYSNVAFTWTGSDDSTQTSNLLYSYKLEGYDSDWSDYGSSTSKTYNGLPNNSYTFKVRARDAAGNVDPIPASLSFTVNVQPCTSSNLSGCLTEPDCQNAGGYWYNGLCHADPLGSPATPLDIWHIRSAPVSNQLWAVTYGKNIFVAVGHNGTILTSPDGTVWTNRSVSGISNLISVAYGNNVFIAVGWDGTILTSPGGVTWTRRISGTSVWLNDVIFAGNTFVVVGNSGTILTSQDGITWTARFSGTTKTLFSVTYGKGVFVVTGGGSDSWGGTYTKLVLTSSDAITWTQRLSGNGKIPTFVAYGNSTFVGIDSDGTVFTSSDGITWIIMDSSIPFDIGIIEEMVYVPSAFIAIGCPSDIFTSPDGITWTSSDSGVPGTLSGVTYGNNSVVIVGLGYIYDDPGNPFGGGTGTNIILQSDPFASPTTPIPVSSQSFTYSATTAPVLSADPSQAKPMGLGPVAEGGGTLSITVKTYQFSGPVDIYFGLYLPEIDPDNIYLLTSGGAFQKLSDGFAPWKANITGPINESLFGDIQTSSLSKGTYYLYLLVTPTGDLTNYYLWITSFGS